jgi:dihydrofolate synthase/folylpolyglutamate synthase
MNYSEVVHYLFTSLPVFQHSGGAAYKPGLQTAHELDNFYGHPHRKYKTIHIAGTNGKGSVSHMLAAVLQGAGYRTGLFTSPHLEDFRERIRVNGLMISEQEVIDFVERSRNVFDKVQPSFFEMTTAMALDHFARQNVDIAIIETGMGGRLDATNIIHPVMSVITNVSLDHTQFLGNNVISIAAEKAGIIKPKVPVVIGETQAGIAQVFEAKANELDCPVVFADQLAAISRSEHSDTGQTFYIKQNNKELPLPITIDLQGDYQQKNIITLLIAVQCLRIHAGFELSYEDILPSLKHAALLTGLHGRWEIVHRDPIIICDTAHNVAGMAWAMRQLKEYTYRQLRIIVGFVNDKDITGLLQLLPADAVFYFTRSAIPRALDECSLKNEAQENGLTGDAYPSVNDAIASAINDAATDDLIFIGGSIFVIAEALIFFEGHVKHDHPCQ